MEPYKPDVKSIFGEALDRAAGRDRLAYPDRTSADHPALCARS